MKPTDHERYIQEVAEKTARIGPAAAVLAIVSIIIFYLLDLYDLEIEGTLLWRGAGLFGAFTFLIGRYVNRSAAFTIYLYAFMLSCFILMMNGIAYLIFSDPPVAPKHEFAVTVGGITVWVVIAMIASGARKLMVYSSIVLMVGLAVFLLASNAESFGFIFSIYLAALFAIIVMRNQERQEREKATFVYQLEEREEKIARQREELQNANESLVSFNYAITHDLKGPLRLAQSFTQLLERRFDSGELPEEEAREFIAQVKSSHSKLHQIIEGLLLLSRIGKNGLNISEVDLESLARNVWKEQIAGREEGKIPELYIKNLGSIQADAKLLWHVLSNLASNAVKYSQYVPAPRVEIGAYREGAQAILYVKDNGTGFDMQYAAELGKPFKRLHSAHDFEGTGIGLAIVRQVVQLHQGRFWAEGAEGRGATFYCAFPDQVRRG